MIDTRLTTFLTLIEEKSYTNTAKKLYITQPAVTHHIKSLEKDYDIVLFDNPKTFELSDCGKLLFEYANDSKNRNAQLFNQLARAKESKKINIGFTNMVLDSIINSNKFDELKELKIGFNANVLKHHQIEDKILRGELDFGIIDYSYDSSKFDSIIIKTNKIVLLCKSDGAYANRERITREMLLNANIVCGDVDGGLYRASFGAIKNKNIRLKNNLILSGSNVNIILKLVDLYDAVAFVYEDSVIDLLNNDSKYKKIELLNFNPTQNFYLLYSRLSYIDDDMKRVISIFNK